MAESHSQPSTPRKLEDTETQTVVLDKVQDEQGQPVLQLRLQQMKDGHKVRWAQDTVDNELLGKKKSKCCCIYEKPKIFGESDSSTSSDEEDECTHCRGHKKKCFRRKSQGLDHDGHCDNDTAGSGKLVTG